MKMETRFKTIEIFNSNLLKHKNMKLKNTIMTIAALCCGILPATAEDFTYDYTEGGIYYRILEDAGNCVEVTKCVNAPIHLVIPPIININGVDYKVISLGPESLSGSKTEYLDLPSSLESIGANSIYGYKISLPIRCYKIKHLTFPENLEFIGRFAFADCRNLKSVIIPDKVKTLEYECFVGCSAVHTVVLGRGITLMEHNAIGGEKWDYKEGIVDWSVLKEVYSLNPVPPEFGEHAVTFTYIKDIDAMVLYVPEESIDKYTEYREPDPYWGESIYDDHGWQWWTFFKTVKPIPDLFIVNDDTELELKEEETARLFSTPINYADVTIYSDKWKYDPMVIKIENDQITAIGEGETVAKRIIETSTGTYESKPIAVKVKGTSGVELPVVNAEPTETGEEGAAASDADHCFFTIDGMAAGCDADRLAPGIYIERDHGKTRKFIKH